MTTEEELHELALRVMRLETMINTLLADVAALRYRVGEAEDSLQQGARRLRLESER